MELFKIKKQIGVYGEGTVGIFEDVTDEGMTLKIARDKEGYWIKVLVPHDEVEEFEGKVDTDTGEILCKGFSIPSLNYYTEDRDKVLELCLAKGYSDHEEAYEDGFFVWEEWVADSFVFPIDLDNIKFEIVRP